eukprot:3351755-Alexandrium_andersonii.AAC.1
MSASLVGSEMCIRDSPPSPSLLSSPGRMCEKMHGCVRGFVMAATVRRMVELGQASSGALHQSRWQSTDSPAAS